MVGAEGQAQALSSDDTKLRKEREKKAMSMKKKTQKDGICPVCGGNLEFFNHLIQDDYSTVADWVCPTCGTKGEQWHDIRFSRHKNVTKLTKPDGSDFTDEELEDVNFACGEVCPICGGGLEFQGDQDITYDSVETTEVSWVCADCGARGVEVSDILFSEHLNYEGDDVTDIQRVAYGRYQLDWMARHGYSLFDLMQALTEYDSDEGEDAPILKLFRNWEFDRGFGEGSLYVCMDEFMGAEYQDKAYIKSLLTDEEYALYLSDLEEA